MAGSKVDRPVVRATDVWRTFGSGSTGYQAIREASCVVLPGDLIALIGPSGSGKSTLLNLLAGLDTPTRGSIEWPALGTRDELRPAKIALVFQGPSLLAPLTVDENVCLPLLLQGHSQRQSMPLAREALERLGVAHLSEKLPEEISGGQAQRAAIARALAMRPALLLADEPTGQLDSETAAQTMTTILACVKELGSAAIVATHDPKVAARFDVTWEMQSGQLITKAPCST
jgi:ABC-type lipoprotein export system ATPase subunit